MYTEKWGCSGGRDINIAAAGVHAATAARDYTDAPDAAINDCLFPATIRGFCL